MINGTALWKQRLVGYINELKRYLRYMLNDHLLFVLLFGIGGGTVFYKQWIDALPADFPYALIAAAVFAPFLTHSPVQTLLKEADVVFLLPAEQQLSSYFRRAFIFSMMMQTYGLLILTAVIAPLHMKFSDLSLLVLFVILVAVKAWNMWVTWKGNYFIEPTMHRLSWGVRFVLNFLLLFFVFVKAHIGFFGSLAAIMLLLVGYFSKATAQKGLKWEQLIAQDAKRMMTFYRIANLFTDVPHLKEQVKRRKWLDFLLPLVSYGKDEAFLYLYIRTFFRASDYFPLYVRLTVIACLMIYLTPSIYGKIAALLFFLYATGFQLFTLSRHHRTKMVLKLYPLSTERRTAVFLRFLFILLIVQSACLSLFILLTNSLLLSLLSLGSGLLFSYIFLFLYAARKWREL